MFTLAEENYLKIIFHLEHDLQRGVTTNAIAERMETKPSSATDMVQKLGEKKMLSYQKYKGAQLTLAGRKIAAEVIRKHRLWEVFLAEKLNFQWDEVHEIAEQLEHIQSKELVARLDAFLGHPEFDPHGDPIPDKHGNLKDSHKKMLSEIPENQSVVCVGVRESRAEFLKYLDSKNISIGTEITILEIENFDGSMTVQVAENTFFISQKTAENIFVQNP